MKIARYRLKGTIVEATEGARTAHVRVDVGNGTSAYAVLKAADVTVATD